jgi:hypothetical protein
MQGRLRICRPFGNVSSCSTGKGLLATDADGNVIQEQSPVRVQGLAPLAVRSEPGAPVVHLLAAGDVVAWPVM